MAKEKELVIIGMAGADESKDKKIRQINDDTLISDAYENKALALKKGEINSVQSIINQYHASGFVKEGNFYVAGNSKHFDGVDLLGAKFFDVNYSLVTNAIRTLEHVLEQKEDEIKSKNKDLWIGFQAMDTILLEKEHIITYLNNVFNFSEKNPNIDMFLQAISQEAVEKNALIKSKPSREFVSYNIKTGEKESFRAIYGGLFVLARPSTEDRKLLKVIGDSMYSNRHKYLQIAITGLITSFYLLMNRGISGITDINKGIDLYKKDKMRDVSFDHLSKVASQIVYQQEGKFNVFYVNEEGPAERFGGDFDRIGDVKTPVAVANGISLDNKYLKPNYRK